MILNDNQLYIQSQCIFLNETLETKLTKPFIGKEITLYHASSFSLSNINPNSYNAGTRLSTGRMSSFWFNNIEHSKTFAVYEYLGKLIKNDINIKCAFDIPNMKVLVDKKDKEKFIKLFTSDKVFIYEKTVPTKLVGRGHDKSIEEFTIDVPVKPDKTYVLTYKDLEDKIIYTDSDTIKKVFNEFKKHKYSSNLINSLVYHKDYKEYTKELKKLNRERSD